MARLFTAGNELSNPEHEGWYFDEPPGASYYVSVSQRGGYRSSELNGGEYYYYMAQNWDLKHFFGTFGRPPSFPVAGAYNELYVRFHFNMSSGGVSGERALLSFMGANDTTFFTLAVYDSGSSTTNGNPAGIRFRENTTGTAHITAAASFINNVWNTFEVRLKLGGGGTGEAEVRVNGVTVGSVVTTLLGPSLETTMAGIHIRNRQNGGTTRVNYFDDVAVNDITGTINNSWPGEGYTVLRTPHKAGATTQLTNDLRTVGPDNADRLGVIDERRPWTDTRNRGPRINTDLGRYEHPGFVAPSSVPQKDTYTIKPLPFDAGAINAISVFSHGKSRNGSLSSNVRLLLTPPAQLEIQTAQLPLTPNEFGPQGVHLDVNPNTSLAFTVTEVEGMELGVQFET